LLEAGVAGKLDVCQKRAVRAMVGEENMLSQLKRELI
jgi:hypothetical protein